MACLEFIYSGQFQIPDPDFAIELVCQVINLPSSMYGSLTFLVYKQIGEANKLQLMRLKALCEDLISKNIDIENAAYVFQVASYHAVPRLRSIAQVSKKKRRVHMLSRRSSDLTTGLHHDQL